MQNELDECRWAIDRLDSELIALLARRRQWVQRAGTLKSQNGQPVYVPEREAELIAARREEAKQQGLDPNLVEDLLHRIIRSAYGSEIGQGFAHRQTSHKKVVIVGGNGQMGQLFARLFEGAGYALVLLDKDHDIADDSHYRQASLVLISVPIRETVRVINQLPRLPENCILADVTSVKSAPLAAMLSRHQGPVIGLHPLFGPDVTSLARQLTLVCHGRQPQQSEWLLTQLQLWGSRVQTIDAEEHDQLMSVIQAARHFLAFVSGLHLMQQGSDLQQLQDCSSPIYRLELMMVGRLFAQNAELYADIIFSSRQNLDNLRQLQRVFNDALAMVRDGDKAAFVETFNRVKAWFGESAGVFLEESGRLLERAG